MQPPSIRVGSSHAYVRPSVHPRYNDILSQRHVLDHPNTRNSRAAQTKTTRRNGSLDCTRAILDDADGCKCLARRGRGVSSKLCEGTLRYSDVQDICILLPGFAILLKNDPAPDRELSSATYADAKTDPCDSRRAQMRQSGD